MGQHQGLAFYTIGQRKGIGLPAGPYYVLNKNIKKNILVITNNEKDLFKKELIDEKCKLDCWQTAKITIESKVKNSLSSRASVEQKYTKYKIQNTKYYLISSTSDNLRPISGFLRGKELLGGGIII